MNAMRAVGFPTCLPHPLKGEDAGFVLCQNDDRLRAIVYDFLRVLILRRYATHELTGVGSHHPSHRCRADPARSRA